MLLARHRLAGRRRWRAWSLLFVVAVALHARLYAPRPRPAQLTLFYLVMSAGGALGGLFTALIAPLVFDWVWEHPLLVLAAALLLPLPALLRLAERLGWTPTRRGCAPWPGAARCSRCSWRWLHASRLPPIRLAGARLAASSLC